MVDAGNAQEANSNLVERANTLLPRNITRDELSIPTKSYFPTDPNITLDALENIYRRNPLANTMINRTADDVFNKWLYITSDNQTLADNIEAELKRLNAKAVFRHAYIMASVHGNSLIFLGFNDWSEDITQEPESIRGLEYIRAISAVNIEKINKDKDITSEDYGKVISYEIISRTGDTDGQVKNNIVVPASRFIHIVNYGADTDENGLSELFPMYNDFLAMEVIQHTLAHVIKRDASVLRELKLPDNLDSTEYDAAEDAWKDFDVLSNWISRPGYEVAFHNTSGGIQPKSYYDFYWQMIGAGSRMGKVALFGTEAGSVSGSEYNFKQYYSYISDRQTEFVEPYLREFIDILRSNGIIQGDGEYNIEWNPREESDPSQLAEVNQKNADSFQKMSQAILSLKKKLVIEDDDRVYIPIGDGKKGILVDGFEVKELKNYTPEEEKEPVQPDQMGQEPGGFTPFGPNITPFGPNITPFGNRLRTNQTKLKPDERMKLYYAWKLHTDKITPKFGADLTKAISDWQEAWMVKFKDIWFKAGMNTADLFAADFVNEVQDMMKDLKKITPSTKNIQSILEQYLEESYTTSYEDTVEAIGVSFPFPIDNPKVRAWLETQAPLLRDDFTVDLNNKYLRAIRDGITAGESYKQINDRLRGITSEFNKGMPNTVHKIVHEAMLKSRVDELEQEGESEVLWMTVGDDRVRDTHLMLEGASPIPISLARQHMADYGCRCTISPYTVLQKLREQGKVSI